MILLLVFAGFVIGSSAAAVALICGNSFVAAFIAYVVFGVGAVILVAVLIAFAPWQGRRPAPLPRAFSPP